MTSESTSSLVIAALAPYYFKKARREYASLTDVQRACLRRVSGMKWESFLLATLYEIDVLMAAEGIQRRELSEFFPDLNTSTFSKWFTEGSISANHFAKLVNLPLFAGKVCLSPRDIAFHGWREGVSWIRAKVLNDSTRGLIRFDAFLFLVHLHMIDVDNIQSAFTLLPERLLRRFPRNTDDWLRRAEWEWGASLRLLTLELTNED